MATATLAWKLAQPRWHPLASIVEELALNAMVRRAEASALGIDYLDSPKTVAPLVRMVMGRERKTGQTPKTLLKAIRHFSDLDVATEYVAFQ